MDVCSKAKYATFAILLLGLSGCGVKTIYNQMDWVLAGAVEDYIHLTDVQDKDVERRIAGILKWHRKSQLPLYSSDLRQVREYTRQGLTEETVNNFFELLNKRWIAIKGKISPEIAGLLLSLSDKQILELFEKVKEQNEEYIEGYVDISQEERSKTNIEHMTEDFERWFGDLNDQQKSLFRQWKDRFKPVHDDHLEFRRAWQKELRLVLNSNMDKNEKKILLIELFNQPENYQSPVYKEKLAYNRNKAAELILAVPLTETQKKHLYKEVDYYTKSFTELAAE